MAQIPDRSALGALKRKENGLRIVRIMAFNRINYETCDLYVAFGVYRGLMSIMENYPAVYSLIGPEELEIGSSGNVGKRINGRPISFWATHIAWVELKDVPAITLEDVRFIEATCIFAASQYKFMERHLRNKQFTKSLGRFEGRKDKIQTVAYEFLAAIADGYSSVTKKRAGLFGG